MFPCCYCSLKFNDKEERLRHRQGFHSEYGGKEGHCMFCYRQFFNIFLFLDHIDEHHPHECRTLLKMVPSEIRKKEGIYQMLLETAFKLEGKDDLSMEGMCVRNREKLMGAGIEESYSDDEEEEEDDEVNVKKEEEFSLASDMPMADGKRRKLSTSSDQTECCLGDEEMEIEDMVKEPTDEEKETKLPIEYHMRLYDKATGEYEDETGKEMANNRQESSQSDCKVPSIPLSISAVSIARSSVESELQMPNLSPTVSSIAMHSATDIDSPLGSSTLPLLEKNEKQIIQLSPSPMEMMNQFGEEHQTYRTDFSDNFSTMSQPTFDTQAQHPQPLSFDASPIQIPNIFGGAEMPNNIAYAPPGTHGSVGHWMGSGLLGDCNNLGLMQQPFTSLPQPVQFPLGSMPNMSFDTSSSMIGTTSTFNYGSSAIIPSQKTSNQVNPNLLGVSNGRIQKKEQNKISLALRFPDGWTEQQMSAYIQQVYGASASMVGSGMNMMPKITIRKPKKIAEPRDEEFWQCLDKRRKKCPRCGKSLDHDIRTRVLHYRTDHFSIFFSLTPFDSAVEKWLSVRLGDCSNDARMCPLDKCKEMVQGRVPLMDHFNQAHPIHFTEIGKGYRDYFQNNPTVDRVLHDILMSTDNRYWNLLAQMSNGQV